MSTSKQTKSKTDFQQPFLFWREIGQTNGGRLSLFWEQLSAVEGVYRLISGFSREASASRGRIWARKASTCWGHRPM